MSVNCVCNTMCTLLFKYLSASNFTLVIMMLYSYDCNLETIFDTWVQHKLRFFITFFHIFCD